MNFAYHTIMTEVELRQDIKQKLPYLMQKLPSMDESELQQLRNMLDAVLAMDNNTVKPNKERFIGSMKGSLVYMADDFNEPLDDFKDYMPDEPSQS